MSQFVTFSLKPAAFRSFKFTPKIMAKKSRAGFT
jgi:hypothetical protein